MKALILFGSLGLIAFAVYPLYEKISIMDTYFNLNKSPVWCDVIFILICGNVVVMRGWWAIYQKLFN